MDETKLKGHVIAMTKLTRIYTSVSVLMFAFLLGFAFQLLPSVPAEAAARRDIPPQLTMSAPAKIQPILAGIQVTQVGGTALRLRFRGFEIPIPRAASAPGESKLVLQWDGARFPQTTDKKDWWTGYDWDILTIDGSSTNSWWKQYDLPLLNRINAEPVDADSLRLTFVTTQPVVIDKIEGVAGADEILVVLKVFQPEKAPEPAERPKPLEKGDPMGIKAPVTLQIKDGDLKSIFRMLADMQKLNIFLDPSVPDMSVSFSFAGMPFNEAFAYLLRAGGLAYTVRGGTLLVASEANLGKLTDTEIKRAYQLSYAVDDSGQVRSDITGALTGLISLSQSPVLDARNRELYVWATEERHKEVAEVLSRLDKPGRQVMLEARIFEVNDSGQQELESLVTAVYNSWIGSFTSSGLNLGYNYANGTMVTDDWSLPIGGSVGGSPAWKTVDINGSLKLLSAGLHALESKGKGKNLASPSVITLDGQQATVSLTQNVKYSSGVDQNGNVTFSEVQSGPRLEFLPIVGREGNVTIKIQIETGEIISWRNAGMGAQAPETSSRRVETTVRVRDGEPFVVGGLYQDNKTSARNRIPVLGYIPLLGEMFTYRKDEHRKNEVAMIVIPHILDVPDGALETFDLKRTSNLK